MKRIIFCSFVLLNTLVAQRCDTDHKEVCAREIIQGALDKGYIKGHWDNGDYKTGNYVSDDTGTNFASTSYYLNTVHDTITNPYNPSATKEETWAGYRLQGSGVSVASVAAMLNPRYSVTWYEFNGAWHSVGAPVQLPNKDQKVVSNKKTKTPITMVVLPSKSISVKHQDAQTHSQAVVGFLKNHPNMNHDDAIKMHQLIDSHYKSIDTTLGSKTSSEKTQDLLRHNQAIAQYIKANKNDISEESVTKVQESIKILHNLAQAHQYLDQAKIDFAAGLISQSQLQAAYTAVDNAMNAQPRFQAAMDVAQAQKETQKALNDVQSFMQKINEAKANGIDTTTMNQQLIDKQNILAQKMQAETQARVNQMKAGDQERGMQQLFDKTSDMKKAPNMVSKLPSKTNEKALIDVPKQVSSWTYVGSGNTQNLTPITIYTIKKSVRPTNVTAQDYTSPNRTAARTVLSGKSRKMSVTLPSSTTVASSSDTNNNSATEVEVHKHTKYHLDVDIDTKEYYEINKYEGLVFEEHIHSSAKDSVHTYNESIIIDFKYKF